MQHTHAHRSEQVAKAVCGGIQYDVMRNGMWVRGDIAEPTEAAKARQEEVRGCTFDHKAMRRSSGDDYGRKKKERFLPDILPRFTEAVPWYRRLRK